MSGPDSAATIRQNPPPQASAATRRNCRSGAPLSHQRNPPSRPPPFIQFAKQGGGERVDGQCQMTNATQNVPVATKAVCQRASVRAAFAVACGCGPLARYWRRERIVPVGVYCTVAPTLNGSALWFRCPHPLPTSPMPVPCPLRASCAAGAMSASAPRSHGSSSVTAAAACHGLRQRPPPAVAQTPRVTVNGVSLALSWRENGPRRGSSARRVC